MEQTEKHEQDPRYCTMIDVNMAHPDFAKVSLWATGNAVRIDTYGGTANDASLRAMRLFSKLGATGCIRNHHTMRVG